MKDNTAIDAVGPVGKLKPDTRRLAARTIASNATDSAECAEFLAMLGLTAEEGICDLRDGLPITA